MFLDESAIFTHFTKLSSSETFNVALQPSSLCSQEEKQKKVSLKKRNSDDHCVSYLEDVRRPARMVQDWRENDWKCYPEEVLENIFESSFVPNIWEFVISGKHLRLFDLDQKTILWSISKKITGLNRLTSHTAHRIGRLRTQSVA